jgi:acyl carrier protein
MSIDNVTDVDAPAAEQAVRRIWKEVFGPAAGEPGATFFELGGDSITAVRLIARIEDELGVAVDVGDIFEEDPDLAALIGKVAAAKGAPA